MLVNETFKIQMRETTLNRGQGSTNFMKDVSMLILALEKLGVHIIFARIVAFESNFCTFIEGIYCCLKI